MIWNFALKIERNPTAAATTSPGTSTGTASTTTATTTPEESNTTATTTTPGKNSNSMYYPLWNFFFNRKGNCPNSWAAV